MARQLDNLWNPHPHTLAKHAILRRYLEAWLPIMTRWNRRIVVIDGFAGPGRYASGEDGSPIVALTAALEHSHPITAELVFLFIEADDERKANLDPEMAALRLLSNYGGFIHCSTFDETVTTMQDDLDGKGQRLAPTFAFVDPFGWSHTPFLLIRRLLSPEDRGPHQLHVRGGQSVSGPAQAAPTLDRLFGTPTWRKICTIRAPALRRQRVHDLYEMSSSSAWSARQVRLLDRDAEHANASDNFLFLATGNERGHVKVKETMWAVDPWGTFIFSDATKADQPVLFQPESAARILRRQIVARFGRQVVAIEEIKRFVSNDTAFSPSHFRRRVLAVIEAAQPRGLEVVTAKSGRRKGQFPPGTMIRFVNPT
jgi:three-Cys-motif partner protein